MKYLWNQEVKCNCNYLFCCTILWLLLLSINSFAKVEHIKEFPDVPLNKALIYATMRMKQMAEHEHSLARMERIAHDYVYAEKGYKDPEMLLWMKADGLTMIESFQADDGTAAMVVRDNASGKYIIAFRGTDQTIDNQQNLDEVLKNRPVGYAQYEGHKHIWDQWAKKYNANGKFFVTGHSRGGGLAALFTASHSGKVDELVMFQAPGQHLADHKKFRQNIKTWPKCTLVVAATDVVQLPGYRHVGEPHVIMGIAKDMDFDKLFGHKSFLLQNDYMTDGMGNLYRNPGDDLMWAEMDYQQYARTRIGAVADPEKFYNPKGKIPIKWGILPLLAEISLAINAFQGMIQAQNSPAQKAAFGAVKGGLNDLGPKPEIFDHLLPPQFHSMEADFYRVFEELIEKDFTELENGTKQKSDMFLEQGIREYIRTNSVESLLAELKNAYEGDVESPFTKTAWANTLLVYLITGEGFSASSTSAGGEKFLERSMYRMKIRWIKMYYQTQKQAFEILADMLEASHQLVRAKIEEGAALLQDLWNGIQAYLLDEDMQKMVNSRAKNPPKPKGKGQTAIKQVALNIKTVQNSSGQAPQNWSSLSRAYEMIHEDLFVDATGFYEFELRLREWEQLSAALWSALFSSIPHGDIKSKNQLIEQKNLFKKDIISIDESFTAQARNKLSKLNVIYKRYSNADIAKLLSDFKAEYKRSSAGISRLSAKYPDWFDSSGETLIINEKGLADLAPRTTSHAMPWLSSVNKQGFKASEEAMKLNIHLSDFLEANSPKVQREEDYILSLLEVYVLESARRGNIREYQASKGGAIYPDGMTLRNKIYKDWINPLSDYLLKLCDLQSILEANCQLANKLGYIADNRSREIAYFGKSFSQLVGLEEKLKNRYLMQQPNLREVSVNAPASSVHVGKAGSKNPAGAYGLGPIMTFNKNIICVAGFQCSNHITTDDFIYDLTDQWRIWNLPEGDTKSANPNARIEHLITNLAEHQAFAFQFGAALAEIKSKADLVSPLHEEYKAVKRWRKQLESSFLAALGQKPLLVKVYMPEAGRASGSGIPTSYALTTECAQAFQELHFDHGFYKGRLKYMNTFFLPKAKQLLADFTAEERRISSEVDARLQKVAKITHELKNQPEMSTLDRASKLDEANKLINYCLAMHHFVNTYAPFLVDYASQTLQANQNVTSVQGSEPQTPSGLVEGFVSDKKTGQPLAGVTVKYVKMVNGDIRSTLTIVTNQAGRFVIDEMPTGSWNYYVNHPGYQAFSGEVYYYSSGDNQPFVAPLVQVSNATTGSMEVHINRLPSAGSATVEITITDRKGRVVARGDGLHVLDPGEYIVNSYAQYMQTEPSSKHFRLAAGEQQTLNISVCQDDEEEDDEPPPITEPQHSPFSESHSILCGTDREFVKSLYHCILEREPSPEEVDFHVNALDQGSLRSCILRSFLLSPEYTNLDKDGRAFMTDAIQAIYSRQPHEKELGSWPRMMRSMIIKNLFATGEFKELTKTCKHLWQKKKTGKRHEEPDTKDDPPPRDDTDDPTQSSVSKLKSKEAYQEYISAYNKLTSIMNSGQGDSPAAQRAYKEYKRTKDIYEALEKEEHRKKRKNPEHPGNTSAQKVGKAIDHGGTLSVSSESSRSSEEIYETYITAYKELTRLAREVKIQGPPQAREISEEYHRVLKEYNRTHDRRVYQSLSALSNRLSSICLKVSFTGPPELKRAQEAYNKAKAEYEKIIKH